MKSRFTIFAVTVLLALAGAVLAADISQTKCPVSGMAINKASSPHIDFQGQRIYFCSDSCPAAFKADPEKYFEKIAADKVVLENVQKICPVTGEQLDNKKSFTDYKGRRLYFCCDACKPNFAKDPVKYLNSMIEQPK